MDTQLWIPWFGYLTFDTLVWIHGFGGLASDIWQAWDAWLETLGSRYLSHGLRWRDQLRGSWKDPGNESWGAWGILMGSGGAWGSRFFGILGQAEVPIFWSILSVVRFGKKSIFLVKPKSRFFDPFYPGFDFGNILSVFNDHMSKPKFLFNYFIRSSVCGKKTAQ